MIIDYLHRHSGHCESGATANLLSHYGIDISEPMAFGIGSGLYFTYLPFIKALDAPLFAFRSVPGRIFKRTMKRLNVEHVLVSKIKDPAEAMSALDRNLDNSIPTGLQVGTYHLKYYPPAYRMHYNFHNVVIFGKEDGVYHVGEPTREKTQIISREDLAKARFAKGHFGPKGKMYFILRKPDNFDLNKAVTEGIKETIRDMTGQPFPLIGTKGMKFLAKQMKKWPEKYPEQKATYYLMQFVRSIEEFGTGGAGFRYIYGAFLKEAGDRLKNDDLLQASREMGETANTWREFSYRSARFIKNRPETHDDFGVLSELLMTCASKEEKVFRNLSSRMKKNPL